MSRRANDIPHGRHVRRSQRFRKKRYLVVCGGTVTEPEYFEHMSRGSNVVIKVVAKALAPSQLADYAAELKAEDARDTTADQYADIAVVVDVDQYHDHAKAQKICTSNGIRLIISNPCFPVWLIDHIRKCPDSYTLTADVEQYAANLGVTTGQRHKYIDFEKIDGCLEEALKNAGQHNTSGRRNARNALINDREQNYAPWTDIPKIIDEWRLQDRAG